VSLTFSISVEGMRAQVEALGHLSGREADDLMGCTLEELTLLVQAYRDSPAPPDTMAWDNFLKVLQYFVQVAGPLATIAGAFTSVFGAATAAKET
jgi:hypothetical protein